MEYPTPFNYLPFEEPQFTQLYDHLYFPPPLHTPISLQPISLEDPSCLPQSFSFSFPTLSLSPLAKEFPEPAFPTAFPTVHAEESYICGGMNYDLLSPLSDIPMGATSTPRNSACSSPTIAPTRKSRPTRSKKRSSAPKPAVPSPPPTQTPILSSGNSHHAQQLHDSGSWTELREYLSAGSFPTSDHATLLEIYYTAIYSLTMIERGLRRLTPTQRYRLRKKYPSPPSISSVKHKANNFHSDSQKELLEAVFRRNTTPGSEEVEMLSGNTGLTEKQIRNFFKNKRSRK